MTLHSPQPQASGVMLYGRALVESAQGRVSIGTLSAIALWGGLRLAGFDPAGRGPDHVGAAEA